MTETYEPPETGDTSIRKVSLLSQDDHLEYYRRGFVDEHFLGPKNILPIGIVELAGYKVEEYVGFQKGIAITREGIIEGDPDELNNRGYLFNIGVDIHGIKKVQKYSYVASISKAERVYTSNQNLVMTLMKWMTIHYRVKKLTLTNGET